jgi:hypothetical protein
MMVRPPTSQNSKEGKKEKQLCIMRIKNPPESIHFRFFNIIFWRNFARKKKKGWFSQLHIHASAMTVVVPG